MLAKDVSMTFKPHFGRRKKEQNVTDEAVGMWASAGGGTSMTRKNNENIVFPFLSSALKAFTPSLPPPLDDKGDEFLSAEDQMNGRLSASCQEPAL